MYAHFTSKKTRASKQHPAAATATATATAARILRLLYKWNKKLKAVC
jgi:hypothetical protein